MYPYMEFSVYKVQSWVTQCEFYEEYYCISLWIYCFEIVWLCRKNVQCVQYHAMARSIGEGLKKAVRLHWDGRVHESPINDYNTCMSTSRTPKAGSAWMKLHESPINDTILEWVPTSKTPKAGSAWMMMTWLIRSKAFLISRRINWRQQSVCCASWMRCGRKRWFFDVFAYHEAMFTNIGEGILQCCGAGAARSRNFWPEPELEPECRSSGSRLRVSLSSK